MKELVLPWPSKDLSPNARIHWSRKARAAKISRWEAAMLARQAGWTNAGLPGGRLHLWIDFYPPTKRLPDDDNMLSRCKAYRDGIADALLIDDKRFVSHPYVKDEVRKGGEVRIRITGGPDAAA
jgi:crossover junction endodeoxyribonuclease RusA